MILVTLYHHCVLSLLILTLITGPRQLFVSFLYFVKLFPTPFSMLSSLEGRQSPRTVHGSLAGS